MTENVKWEVVDEAAPKPEAAAAARPSLDKLLGRWWRWKVGAMLALGAFVLALLVALAGMAAVAVAAVALPSLGVTRLKRWLHGGRAGPLARRHPQGPY